WKCPLKEPQCSSSPAMPEEISVSPDRRWAVFYRNGNLWGRNRADGNEFVLTQDASDAISYGGSPGVSGHKVTELREAHHRAPQVLWSPDSSRALTYRVDESAVKLSYLVQSTPDDGAGRAKLFSYHYPLVGDQHVPLAEPVAFDLQLRKKINFR